MKRASLLFALVAAILLAFLIRAQMSPDPAERGAAAEPPPESGMALIESYGCRSGETRRVSVRGVEDNYASAGREPARMHPRLRKAMIKFDKARADYDSRVPDHPVGDWFELPPDTASALLVVRYRPIGDNLNDTIAIGDLSDPRLTSSTRAAEPDPRFGWKRSGDLHWVELSDLPMWSGGKVLDLVKAPHASGIIDVQVVDDSSVDFSAIVYCQLPARRMGVTLGVVSSPKGMASFHCWPDMGVDRDCNPFVGDEPCGNALPLLCFHDLQAPAPAAAMRFSALTRRSWSGGEVAATSPVSASQFATITDADRFCSSSFGKGWRAAEWHAGGWGYGFAARSNGRSFSGRYWVDIRGSPYGTCWSRDHGR